MEITLTVSDNVEATSYPWWIVIDADRIIPCPPDDDDDNPVPSVSWRDVAGAIHGPFFSREEGEAYIKANRHNLGKDPVCYCKSAWMTDVYKQAMDRAKDGAEQVEQIKTEPLPHTPIQDFVNQVAHASGWAECPHCGQAVWADEEICGWCDNSIETKPEED